MASAGTTTREIDLSGPTEISPGGIPAGVVGTAQRGPAFVPTTVATTADFITRFGQPTNESTNAPLAALEWLRNAPSVTFLRVLGAGDGNARTTTTPNAGRVVSGGFVVGDRQPQDSLNGNFGDNPYAVAGGEPGRTYFLGCYMKESAGSTIFTDANMPLAVLGNAVPILRGVIFAASGVIIRLSSSAGTTDNTPPDNTTPATNAGPLKGFYTGSVYLLNGKQEFVLLLNGHKNTSAYPNVITASFDPNAPNYFGRILNKDPLQLEKAGYVLYTYYDIHPSFAVPTGSGIIHNSKGASVPGNNGLEPIAFILTGSYTRNDGTPTKPNYENFEDRFRTAFSPMVISQKFGGSPVNLFRIHALDDGEYPNARIKISIENITPSTSETNRYGTFDLIVRDFYDTDQDKIVLEEWRNLSLDPSSPRFIANVIGDMRTYYNFDAPQGLQKLQTTGLYPNKSKYIRVEVTQDVLNGLVDPSALPVGFRGHAHLVTSGSAPMPAYSDNSGTPPTLLINNPFHHLTQPPVPMRLYLKRGDGTVNRALYWGVQFEQQNSVSDANNSTVPNTTIAMLTKYFPDFQKEYMNFLVYGNEGTPDTTDNGVLDADRFNNNMFSLEKIKVKYNPTTNLADVNLLADWVYVRTGNIPVDTVAKTRAWNVNDLTDNNVRLVSKFTFFIQNGFDGVRIFNSDTKALTNKAIVEEMNNSARGYSNGPTVKSYLKSIEIIKDANEVDIQVLAMPGIRHRFVTDTAIRATEERFDAIFIMDIEEMDINNSLVIQPSQQISVSNTIVNFRNRGLDTSFAAAYFPDVNVRDPFNRRIVRVPPSVAVLGAIAKNDSLAYPWFAPAGYNRATLDSVVDTILTLTRQNMDDLYSVNINPITSFAGSRGVVIWGQKTLLNRQSSLDRINVRRLLIAIRREVRRVANRILFEQNRETTLERFAQLVTPILKRIQDLQGLNNFKVVIDTTTTTQADIENKTIRGKIFLQPTHSLEFLSLDFVITNRGNFVQA